MTRQVFVYFDARPEVVPGWVVRWLECAGGRVVERDDVLPCTDPDALEDAIGLAAERFGVQPKDVSVILY